MTVKLPKCLQIHLCTIRRGIQLIVYTIITTKSVLLFSLCLWLELMVVLCTLLQILSAVLLVNKIISISCRRPSLVPNVLYVIRKYAKILRRCLGIAIIRGSVLPFTDMEWLPWEGFFSRNAAVTNRKVDDGKGDLLPGSTLIKFYWTYDCVCDVVITYISVCICMPYPLGQCFELWSVLIARGAGVVVKMAWQRCLRTLAPS